MTWRRSSVSADGSHHVVDGAPLYALRFDGVLPFREPGLAPVHVAGSAWHVVGDGAPAYGRRFLRTFGFYEGRAAVQSADGWHHILPDGSDLTSHRRAWCGNFQGDRCAVRDVDGRYHHLRPDGTPAYAARWRYAGDFRDGAGVVQADDGRSTHIDPDGRLVHGRWLVDLDVFHKSFACARDEGGWMHIDPSGRPAYRRRFARVEPFYNGQARVEQGDGRRLVIDERGATVIELRAADLDALVPPDRAVVVFLRHAERPPMPAAASGDDLPLTSEGRRAAERLGASLGSRIATITTSPVRRCRETALALVAGAGIHRDIGEERLLGAPGAFVADAEVAWRNWQELGNEGVIEHVASSDRPLAGMVDPVVAVRRLVELTRERLGGAAGIHVFVTHDAVLAPLVSRLRGSGRVIWPDYLAAALFWRDGARLSMWCDGHASAIEPGSVDGGRGE